jgi:hypothetical protein
LITEKDKEMAKTSDKLKHARHELRYVEHYFATIGPTGYCQLQTDKASDIPKWIAENGGTGYQQINGKWYTYSGKY